jgi:methylated-DNA-[protein]-cysteine S-methyltransferase
MLLVCDGAVLVGLDFDDDPSRLFRLIDRFHGAPVLEPGTTPDVVAAALDAYFEGHLAALDGIAVRTGGTALQQSVWRHLQGIAAGTRQSYGVVAAALGRPLAARAVGHATASNPVSIVIPCHRLVGSKGALTGYAGGLERKSWLLAHEARHSAGC